MSFNPQYFYPTIITNITQLNGGVFGTVKPSDVYPAVDVTDVTQSPMGTTKPYQIISLFNYIIANLGFTVYQPVLASTLINLTATYNNGASGVGATLTNSGMKITFALDNITGVQGGTYLIKNQTAPAQNGLYTLTTIGDVTTNWVLTRSINFNQVANIFQNGVVFVQFGSVNGGTFWQDSFTSPITVGTTNINWSAWNPAGSSSGTVNAGLINELAYYATNGTTVSGLPTNNNGLLVTSAGGVPSISTTLPAGLTIPGYQASLTFPLSLALGGTNANLTSANGAIPYSTATQFALLAPGTSGQLLQSGGAAAPTWTTATYPVTAGTAGNALVSNGTNFVSKSVLPTVQQFTSGSGTYTKPAGCTYIDIEMVGGGAGGEATGSGFTPATNGGDTTFSTATAGGGLAQTSAGTSSASGGTINIGGSAGAAARGANAAGGAGGGSYYGGGGLGGTNGTGTAGAPASTNSGSGGGGAGGTVSGQPSYGGGAGGFVRWLITSPASTYAYSVGAAGAGGIAGSGGVNGGNGAAGLITIFEYYI